MKTLFYLLSIILLNILTGIEAYAQNKKEEIIIREGDLVFLKSISPTGRTAMRRAGSEKLIEESYMGSMISTPNVDDLTIEKEFFQKLFTQERIKELAGGRLICSIRFNGIKQEIMYVKFTWVPLKWEGESDFPLTLQELDLLEKNIKAYPFTFRNTNTNKQDQFSILTNYILFSRLLEE